MDMEDLSDKRFTLYRSGLLVVSRITVRKSEETRVEQRFKRTYKVKKSVVKSACIDLFLKKQSKHLLFITFTLPFEMDETKSVKCWNSLLNNLRNNYEIKNYVWVKERQKSGRVHYHILIDRVYVGVKDLQTTWNTIIKNVTGVNPDFNNSVRLGFNPIVRNIKKVKNYLSKYMAKDEDGKEIEFNSKPYGYTQGLTIKKEIQIEDFQNFFNGNYKIYLIANDKFFRLYVLLDFIDTT